MISKIIRVKRGIRRSVAIGIAERNAAPDSYAHANRFSVIELVVLRVHRRRAFTPARQLS
jgi:hypothetical protein